MFYQLAKGVGRRQRQAGTAERITDHRVHRNKGRIGFMGTEFLWEPGVSSADHYTPFVLIRFP